MRLATMDHYDGMVWGATDNALPEPAADSFQRVSSTIDNPVEGERVDATVTIGEAYDGVWLPTVGALQSLDFRLGDPDGKAEVVPLQPRHLDGRRAHRAARGGHLLLHAPWCPTTPSTPARWPRAPSCRRPRARRSSRRPPPSGPRRRPRPSSGSTPSPSTCGPRASTPTASAGPSRSTTPATASSACRTGFVQAQQMVGNDEQYAAMMALLAGEVGVPARVVLGAEVPEGGVVTGKDVSAWVELRAADGSWRTLPTEDFMSDEPPADQLPETNTPMTGTVVPPPAPIPPPSDAGDQSDADLKERKADKKEADEEDEESVVERPARLGRAGRDVRRRPAAGGPARGRRDRRPQAAAPPPSAQRDRRLGALRRGLARAGRPRPRPRPAGAPGADRHPARAVRGDRVRAGALAGAPGRRLRLRPERPPRRGPRRPSGRLWTPSGARCRGPWAAGSGCSPRSTSARCGRPGRGCGGRAAARADWSFRRAPD